MAIFNHTPRAIHHHHHGNPDQAQSTVSNDAGGDLGLQRLENEALVRKAQRHMEHDNMSLSGAELKKKKRRELEKGLGMKNRRRSSMSKERRAGSGKKRTGPNRDPGPRVDTAVSEPNFEETQYEYDENNNRGSGVGLGLDKKKKKKKKRSSDKYDITEAYPLELESGPGLDKEYYEKYYKDSRASLDKGKKRKKKKRLSAKESDTSQLPRKRSKDRKRESRLYKARKSPKDERSTTTQRDKVRRKDNKVGPSSSAIVVSEMAGPTPSVNLIKTYDDDDSGSGRRPSLCDAVVFIAVLGMLLGITTSAFEIYALLVDVNWNNIVSGQAPFEDFTVHKIFEGKTLHLSTHEYLRLARDYSWRYLGKEYAFLITLGLVIFATAVHIFLFYLREKDFDSHAKQLIALYIASGAICIMISVLPVSSAINIENSYTYAAEMLYNFQHMLDEHDATDEAGCKLDEYAKACPDYEFAKKQASHLEDIYRLCGSGSRYTRYYGSTNSNNNQPVKIAGELYFRHELKHIGFCSPDGYKYIAAIFSVVTGMLFSVVPIVFCCETTSSKQNSYFESRPPNGNPSILEMTMDALPPPPALPPFTATSYETCPPSAMGCEPAELEEEWKMYVEGGQIQV